MKFKCVCVCVCVYMYVCIWHVRWKKIKQGNAEKVVFEQKSEAGEGKLYAYP